MNPAAEEALAREKGYRLADQMNFERERMLLQDQIHRLTTELAAARNSRDTALAQRSNPGQVGW